MHTHNMKKTILTESGLTDWLHQTFDNAKELAKAADITTAGAYRLWYGHVRPSPKTLDRLGIEIKYEVQP